MNLTFVKTESILKMLESDNIKYELFGSYKNEYAFASMFAPIANGFYFLTGRITLPSEIIGSLILCSDKEFCEVGKNENAFILIDEDPQLIYYKLVKNLVNVEKDNKISIRANIHPEAVIGENVFIGDYCTIGNVIIGDNCQIDANSYIENNTVIGNNVKIGANSAIGIEGIAWIWDKIDKKRIILPQLGGVIIGNNCQIAAGALIVRGSLNENTVIGENSLIAPGVRLGHGTQIGNNVHFANNITTGGNTVIGDYSFVGSGAIFRPKVKIHNYTIVGAGALVVKNTSEERKTLIGSPARETLTKEAPSGMPKPL